jgi:hypothetical protein
LREVKTEGKNIEMKIHRTDGGSVNFYQLVLKCGGDVIRYHKVSEIIGGNNWEILSYNFPLPILVNFVIFVKVSTLS